MMPDADGLERSSRSQVERVSASMGLRDSMVDAGVISPRDQRRISESRREFVFGFAARPRTRETRRTMADGSKERTSCSASALVRA